MVPRTKLQTLFCCVKPFLSINELCACAMNICLLLISCLRCPCTTQHPFVSSLRNILFLIGFTSITSHLRLIFIFKYILFISYFIYIHYNMVTFTTYFWKMVVIIVMKMKNECINTKRILIEIIWNCYMPKEHPWTISSTVWYLF